MKTTARGMAWVAATLVGSLGHGAAAAGDLTANVAVSNNYIWRGLTQNENGAAVQGGLDYTAGNGFYAGTWASNVTYLPGDPFSYEHDLYLGIRGGETLLWDVGYLYYNYDQAANYDFSEAYVALGWNGFTLKYSTLVQTERDESLDAGTRGVGPTPDYGFGSASYVALDYAYKLPNEITLGFHVGRHDGDFARSFNAFTSRDYVDYNVSVSKGNFKFMVTDTNLSTGDQYGSCTTGTCGGFGPDTFSILPNNNREVKFVVSYTMPIDL
ncbi:MAG: TorF family putative porin [Steroidobacteraceae bacterium]|nr:TorF family putative porin [Steroidobacteraceae bacterium]